MLYGRGEELAAIDRLLGHVREGREGAEGRGGSGGREGRGGTALVLRGEAGIGKTALLEYAAAQASGTRVLRCTGAEYESGMPYAGLHMLLARHLGRIDSLPDAQARALRAALNMGTRQDGDGGDRFLVGLAVLTLLADLAEEQPLLVLIDDAQWLDGPSVETLLFAARRLEAEPIALLFAARDMDAPEFLAPGLPELRLQGLDKEAATELLASHAAALPGHAVHEVLGAAMGNPLALLELPHLRTQAHDASSAYTRIQRSFAEKIAALPEPSRTLLLLVAADDLGSTNVVVAAGARLGASVADLEPAERGGLLRPTADGRLEVRHPMVRTAAYGEASLNSRIAVHRALAGAYADRGDHCHRARHLARSAVGPDEEVAAVLESTADAERGTGGDASAAAMYESAAALSPAPADRGRRLAEAARAYAFAGLAERAVELAARAEADLADPIARAGVTLIRASLADGQDRAAEAYRMFAETAESVAALDPRTSGYLFFQAAGAAANAGDLASVDAIAARGTELDLPNASHLRALSRVFAGQDPMAAPGDLTAGIDALHELMDGMNACYGPYDRVRIGMWHILIGDLDGAAETAAGLERRYRAQGAIGLLAPVLMIRSRAQLMLGRHRDARTAAAEGLRIAADTGQHRIRVYLATVLALLAAIEGDEAACTELTEEALSRAVPPSSVHAAAARGLLDLGLGRHDAALSRLSDVVAGPGRLGAIASVPDLVEAAVRAGRPDLGRDAARRYADWARRIGRPWTEAIALRCAALLAAGDSADALFARAVELHREGGTPFERARTELLYGEWLRRSRRRNDARAVLHPALEAFERLGAAPWAERVRVELRAAGESIVAAGGGSGDDLAGRLTPQELQVVRLAAAGLSNREIGAQLFLSPRTVGYHLYKAYPKLGVASRGELARLPLS